MRVRFCRLAAACAAAALALPAGGAPAQAQDDRFGASGYDTAPATNIYVEGRAALTLLMDQDVSGDLDGDASFDPGFGGSLAVGYHVLDSLRVELEGIVDVNDVDAATPVTPQGQQQAPRGGSASGVGDTITTGGFVNAAYDIDTGTAFTPYVGGGFGVLRIDAEYGAYALNDDDVLPAYQVLTGVSWNVVRRTALTLSYRYRRTVGDPEFTGPSGDIETEYGSHGFQLGLRYRF